MKIGMMGITSNVPTRLTSHNGGWSYVCKDLCENIFKEKVEFVNEKSDLESYDILIINEGVNYREGSYNFFGGVQEPTKIKLSKLQNFNGDLFCINEFIDLNDLVAKRKDLNGFEFNYKTPKVIKTDSVLDNLIIGDSHSVSVYKPGYCISRNDGKTLFGFLKDPNKYIYGDALIDPIKYNKKYNKLITYFGNIDIRFHLCRQSYPVEATKKLALQYVDWCKKNNATPVCLLPIENEDRKIPKTGLYKGQPFYGTKELRSQLVILFNQILELNFLDDCITWPAQWYHKDYDFTINMEARQSVHLSPNYYKYKDQFIITNQQTLF